MTREGLQELVRQRLHRVTVEWHPQAREVLDRMVDHLYSNKVWNLMRSLGLPRATVESRLLRWGLPSVKRMHERLRVYAFCLAYEDGRTKAAAWEFLDMSSPQSGQRFMKRLRTQHSTAEQAWDDLLYVLNPYDDSWTRLALLQQGVLPTPHKEYV
jgi:hypothetical protein